jgi:mRNA-capping enzyme
LDVVAVHCTHGFNRTGFLICAYLIEKLDWSVEAAVNAFAKSRPPGIYKEEYIKELFSRYGDIEDAPPAPPLPDWCHELNDEDDEGVHITNKSTNSNHYDSRKKKPFMEGVNGVKEVTNPSQIRFVQQKCQELCQFRKNGFPGSQPVSMDNNNKHFISEKEYMVSWKADGNRYMMFVVGANQIYFIDRDNTVFFVEGITFPKRKDSSKHLENTLMDGEMILDVVNGHKVPRYLIYDIITYESQNVGGTDFRRRLLCIDKEIIGPREKAKEEGIIDRSREPFGIRKKDFWELRDTFKIFGDNFKRNLTHEIDGLIFQPVADPYLAGRCDSVLKWKPPSHNSVDFKLRIYREERPGMLKTMIGNLYVGPPNNKMPFATMKVKKDLKEYDNKIIECTFNMATNEWVFMRERTDKSFPNSYDTAVAVCNSIRFPITKEVLLDFIEKEGWKPRVVKRPQSQEDNNNLSRTDRNLMPPPIKAPRKS